jgi:hypothetical protein
VVVVFPPAGETVPLLLSSSPPSSLPRIGTLMLNFRQTSWKRVVKTNLSVSQSVSQSSNHLIGAKTPTANKPLRECEHFFFPMRRQKGNIPKRSSSGSSQLFSAQAEMFVKIPSWRTQWQYWSSSVQLTEAMAGGSQVFCSPRRMKVSVFEDLLLESKVVPAEVGRRRRRSRSRRHTTQGGIKAA